MPETNPPVVAVLNPKGGSGKSTIAVNVACVLHRRGSRALRREAKEGAAAALLVDTDDPQFSAARWRERGEEAEPGHQSRMKSLRARGKDAARRPFVIRVEEGDELATAWENPLYDAVLPTSYVVVDGAGQLDGKTGEAVRVADAVLIPVQPSPLDLWGVEELVPVIRARQEQTGGAPRAAFVVSQARAGTRLSGDAAEALESYGLPIFEARTGQRVAYAESMAGGGSVLDRPSSKAAAEIEAIADELQTLL